ncbi:3331_t:CDS:2, partial [Diversispora eburnea]
QEELEASSSSHYYWNDSVVEIFNWIQNYQNKTLLDISEIKLVNEEQLCGQTNPNHSLWLEYSDHLKKQYDITYSQEQNSKRQSGGAPVVISFRIELDDILDENRIIFKPVTLISSASTENTNITINRQTKKCSLPVTSTDTSTLIESKIGKQKAKEKARRDEERCKLISLLINRQLQNSGTLYITNTLSPVLNYIFQNSP